MPNGFNVCADLNSDVNPNGLDMNCYYCTVAALAKKSVVELVMRTETMQQDTAQYHEIQQLFADAGLPAGAFVGSAWSHQPAGPADLVPADWMGAFLTQVLGPGQCGGLAYVRPDGSGHMVVVGKHMNFPSQLVCADFQQPANSNLRLVPFPPEQPNGATYGYQVWLSLP